VQFKGNLEKNKQSLESENKELAVDVKSLQQLKGESEHKRKKLESQLQEFMSRTTEVERVKAELSERSHRLQVNASRDSKRRSLRLLWKHNHYLKGNIHGTLDLFIVVSSSPNLSFLRRS